MLPYHAATRPMNHHRDIYAGPNVYRPNVYRPDYDHYEPPPETFVVRGRSASWSSSGKPSSWNDRRTSLGAGPSRDADMLASRMAMAPSRMFEPSDSWKHTHDEPRLIPRVGGDRYRPAINDGGAYLHGRADVYRPSYDNSRSVRRQSGSDRRGRNSASRRSPSRSRSRSLSSTSRSAASLSRSPFRTSSTKSRSPIRRRRSSPDSSKRRSRSSSAFSVASSRPSVPPPNVNSHTTVSPHIRSNSPLPKADPDLGASEEQAQPPPPSVTPDVAPVSPLLSHATQPSSMQTETAKTPEPPKEEASGSFDIPITASPTSPCAAPSSTEPAIPIPTSPVAASPQKLEETKAKPATQLDLTNVRDPDLTVDSRPRDAHLATDQTVDTVKGEPMEPDATPAKLPTSQEPNPSAMLVEPDTLPEPKSEVPTVDDAPVPALITDQPPDEPADNIVPPSPQRPALDEIPKFADTMRERLRIVVMTRLAHDTQSREEIIAPILTTNLSIARHEYREGTTADVLMQEILRGDKAKTRLESLEACKPSLVQQFETRQIMLMEKVERLRNEYIDLHEKWLVHCATLDEQAKPSETEAVQPSGRTTRRTANLTDTVRSDLEMEQIIASLGNDDATDPNHLSQRNLAVIPDMISVTRGQVDYAFDDTNHLVTDPHEYYAPRTGIDDWTEEEKAILCDKFAAHPKQFGIIADYLPNKTQAQCVSYYYLHKKKFINFRKVVAQRGPGKRKRRSDKRKGNALLTDIQRHDEELEGDSMSPTPTSAPTTTNSGRPRRRAAAQQPAEPVASRRPQPRRSNAHQLEATPASTPTPEPESRVRRRRSNQVVAPPTPVEEPEEDPATVIYNRLYRKRTKLLDLNRILNRGPRRSLREVVKSSNPPRSSLTILSWTTLLLSPLVPDHKVRLRSSYRHYLKSSSWS
ncbi:hypothetical protein BDN71DRAFT_912129 [Pleurotus eryngii]|uniref:SANT domain-containing protein n=1 Tax=Pleurotus eryngii TaxID=5323 RepID=A0A9P6A0F0_PLEER|nr:hypothetical protein BDN71DRAFT_912129 [Pleurotus eryngii]